ncbi:MAG: hypothetical protein AVDCRST_MAG56-6011 [uncultured Cytophagales bacterium]|uniref:Uncharacterized protein n=1 Tax=uncultured Cytophagales bacterium TaxID=158755 RepID=A0A6J4KK21_9SPHI|nr:MAG: hypothetical protein AVDCRST_MAG56-6011 [uncultured Cytophagales bacterium]
MINIPVKALHFERTAPGLAFGTHTAGQPLAPVKYSLIRR